MTLSTLTNRLLNEGTIERIRVNRYILHSTFRTDALHYRADDQAVYTMSEIHQAFATGDPLTGTGSEPIRGKISVRIPPWAVRVLDRNLLPLPSRNR